MIVIVTLTHYSHHLSEPDGNIETRRSRHGTSTICPSEGCHSMQGVKTDAFKVTVNLYHIFFFLYETIGIPKFSVKSRVLSLSST